jgi:hypothetical protein
MHGVEWVLINIPPQLNELLRLQLDRSLVHKVVYGPVVPNVWIEVGPDKRIAQVIENKEATGVCATDDAWPKV